MTSLKQRGLPLIGPGPVHHGDHPQAFGLESSKQLWYGFIPCRVGGDPVALVQRMDHRQYPELARYLASLAQLCSVSEAILFPLLLTLPNITGVFRSRFL